MHTPATLAKQTRMISGQVRSIGAIAFRRSGMETRQKHNSIRLPEQVIGLPQRQISRDMKCARLLRLSEVSECLHVVRNVVFCAFFAHLLKGGCRVRYLPHTRVASFKLGLVVSYSLFCFLMEGSFRPREEKDSFLHSVDLGHSHAPAPFTRPVPPAPSSPPLPVPTPPRSWNYENYEEGQAGIA